MPSQAKHAGRCAAKKKSPIFAVCAVLFAAAAVMIGGRSAIRSSSAPPLPQSLAVALCLYAVVWLVAIGGETDFAAHGPLLTGAIFGGAMLAGLPGRKKGKRQAGTRRAGERPRRATAHGRR